MKLSHPVVFIFGAGATRGALSTASNQPPPLDADFFEIAGHMKGHGTPTLVKRVQKDVWELYQKTSGVALENYYRDIETRAIIGTFAKTVNQPKNWARRQSDLEELIRRVYIHTTCDTTKKPSNPLKSTVHEKILHSLTPGDTILTFNYDMVIEESFDNKTAKLWNPTTGYGVRASGGRNDWCRRWYRNRSQVVMKKSKVRVLKLHGSLNWTLYNNQTIRLKPRPYVVRTKDGQPSFEKISILAPGWNKRIDRNPYKKFWREARLCLEKCKALVILGYSLPETDLLARALLAEVARLREARHKYLRELHLGDPSEVVKQRFIDLFTPALGPHGRIFRYSGIKEFSNALKAGT